MLIREKYEHLKTLINLKTESIERATNIAKAEVDRRLEGMNEFREQLKEQTGTFITKEEHGEITKQNASMKSVYIGYIVSLIGIILAAIAIFK
jgi:hypothetical protein